MDRQLVLFNHYLRMRKNLGASVEGLTYISPLVVRQDNSPDCNSKSKLQVLYTVGFRMMCV